MNNKKEKEALDVIKTGNWLEMIGFSVMNIGVCKPDVVYRVSFDFKNFGDNSFNLDKFNIEYLYDQGKKTTNE